MYRCVGGGGGAPHMCVYLCVCACTIHNGVAYTHIHIHMSTRKIPFSILNCTASEFELLTETFAAKKYFGG